MSVLARIFKPKPDPREALRPLWHAVVERSRDPQWYRGGGVADTVAGRFDMITAILGLVLLRLEPEGETAPSQALLTELFVEDMDGQLRESGVGDLVVGKHIGRLVSALGGRLGAFRRGLASGDAEWRQALGRNVTFREGHASDTLAAMLLTLRDQLAQTSTSAILAGDLPR